MTISLEDIGVLFDLDGTLVDSSEDLIQALKLALDEHQVAYQIPENIKRSISLGSKGMLKKCIQQVLDEKQVEKLQQSMLQHYQENNGKKTKCFAGMSKLLGWLEQQTIPWGIVTNKQARFARPLMKTLNLNEQTVISVDTCMTAKPHPEPMLLAAQHIQRRPTHIFYLGDDLRDIQAANASGMQSVAVTWGFHAEETDFNTWPKNHIIDSPEQLIDLIQIYVN